MLYLAEVQKKSGFIGSGRPEFRLLACQRSEYLWTAVTGDEVLIAPDDASYNSGALVMVEVNGNRQVQRHYEAGRTLTNILQTFSNLSKKSKTQEEEIEQWKQSLTYQSQELNRRELEIEARQEQLERAEADLEQLEVQRQEVENLRQTLEQQQAELTRKNHDLEGAWAHLKGEMRRLEENQGARLTSITEEFDRGQFERAQVALQRLTEAILPLEVVREPLAKANDGLANHQEFLSGYQQNLESQGRELKEYQQQLEQQNIELAQQWANWHQSEAILTTKKEELKLCQQSVRLQQEEIQILSQTLRYQANLHRQLYSLLSPSDKVRLSKKVDVNKLEAMGLEALEILIQDLQKDLDQVSRFVSEQEEELTLEQQAMEEIKFKIKEANDVDPSQLETRLAEEQDRYQMLNETLVGQRRNLIEREEILSQHQAVLKRRQGLVLEEHAPAPGIDLEPHLNTIDEERQRTSETIHQLELQINQTQTVLNQLKLEISSLEADLASRRTEVEAFEGDLRQQQLTLAGLAGKLEVCQDLISPAKHNASGIGQSLAELTTAVAKLQEFNDYQIQSIAELRQTILSFSENHAVPAL
ncbi:MAG: pilus motility taxis protein HmpF [Nodosilinea sp.]